MFDIATLLVSLTAVELIMSAVLLLFTATGHKVKGIIELALALFIGSFGSFLAFAAATPPVNRYFLFAASVCFVIGILLTARAMRSLQFMAPRKVMELSCLAIALIFNGWFILGEFYIVGMFVVNSALFAMIGLFSAVDLLSEKRPDLKPGCRILGIMFGLFASFMAFRALARPFIENGTGPHPQVTTIDTMAALVAIATAILWAVGYLWTVYGASEYRLKRANADLERFTGAVAHDLKAPLNSIVGFLGILKQPENGRDPEKTLDYLNSANEAAWRMNEIIDDLLEQATNANEEQVFKSVDTQLCSSNAVKNLDFHFKSTRSKIMADDLPVVWGNKTQLTRLFQNLYDNAIKYQNPNKPPVIIVKAACQDGTASFSVRDNGIGVPDDANETIFDYMQRVDAVKKVTGAGVGLAECRRIVEVHGGTIWVESLSDGGSAFHFTLKLPTQSDGT